MATYGYGRRGRAFKKPKAYNASYEGQRHAKNPNLSVKPVAYGKKGNAFFSKAAAGMHRQLVAKVGGIRKGGGSGRIPKPRH